MLFHSIPGREALKKFLLEGVRAEKIPHAQLFSGNEGSGNLAFAMAYAQYILCQKKTTVDSCGVCSTCVKTQKLIHPDLHFSFPFAPAKKEDHSGYFMETFRKTVLEKPFLTQEEWIQALSLESKMLNIPISECREIIRQVSMKSFEGGYQILILWLPEYLKESANSLLKLMEEPSPGTVFLLVTENREAILATLLSRMQHVTVAAPTLEEVKAYLVDTLEVEESAADTISFLADGNLSRALSLARGTTDQFEQTFHEWLGLLKTGNGLLLVEWVENFNGKSGRQSLSKEDKKNFLLYCMKRLRQKYLGGYPLHSPSGREDIRPGQAPGAGGVGRVGPGTSGREDIGPGQTPGVGGVFRENYSPGVHAPTQHGEISPAIRGVSNPEALAAFTQVIQELEKAVFHLDRNCNPKILFLDVSLRVHPFLKGFSLD